MKEQIARILLEKKAVTLNTKEPYTYVSGIRSPIYTDNRLFAAFPVERKIVVDAFVSVLKGMDYDIIAGTSTAGIQWAAWVADKLDKPMSYIRGGKKAHGKGSQIEGAVVEGKKVVVIEDLVSTGGSSLGAVEACRDAGAEVTVMVAIFTYGFEKAEKKFKEAGCDVVFLTDFSALVKYAADNGFIEKEELDLVLEWNRDPQGWGPKHGFPLGEKKN